MADIEVRCSQCDAVIRISEFADASKTSCHHCGGSLSKPQSLIATATKPGLHLATHKVDHTASQHQTTGEWNFNKTMNLSKDIRLEKDRKPKVSQHFLAWVLFILFGGAMYLGRYQYLFPPNVMLLLDEYAIYVVGFVYVMIIVRAFADTIYQGILCVICPLYPFYYIFMVSDNFYFRAFVGGLLIGMGEDSGKDALVIAKDLYETASEFIEKGGGDIREEGGATGWHGPTKK